ncbi:MAG: CoA transferase [Pseudomonadales bacterium]|nr:CoA transferase [Pseudomonadales bacterium]
MVKVLEGVRVLDFGRYIAGPYCAALLGDLGADVIRIERVGGGEDRFVSPVMEDGTGAGFFQVNRNKRSLSLNPTKPEGREIVKALVKTADVVVANLPAPTLKSMGLDLESLHDINPKVILATASAFGSEGPYSERVGFDGIGQVMSGSTHLTGQPDMPQRCLVPYVDFATATNCAYGTLAALMARDKTGVGQMVEGSLLRSALTVSNTYLIEEDILALNRQRRGNRAYNAGPSDIFKTKDGWILAQVVGNNLFKRWVTLVDCEQWLDDERFKDDDSRAVNGEVISAKMNEWCADYTSTEAIELLAKSRIPAGEVLSPNAVLEDPQVQTMLKPQPYPDLGKPAQVVGPPVSLSDTPTDFYRRAPTAGEHTDEVLAEIGYDEKQIIQLRENRII